MGIKTIVLSADGYVHCSSCFYSAQDIVEASTATLSAGLNWLTGDIDSGVWAISYILSMHQNRPKDFILFEQPRLCVDQKQMKIEDFVRYTCYMDRSFPLFSSKRTVRQLVVEGLKKCRSTQSPDKIRDLFHIDAERFERPLTGVGNEIFRAMAAIGYANGKQVFCFPWLSKKRFDGYHGHMTDLLSILEKLQTVVILPVGK